jgi:hypothetical protein
MSGKRKFKTNHDNPVVRFLESTRARLRISQKRMAEKLDVPFHTYQKWVYEGQNPRNPDELVARAMRLAIPRRLNCWEVLSCGRGPEGTEPPCPAATDTSADGVNAGLNGGRICWAIAGTFCPGKPDGGHANDLASCFGCEFFRQVLEEEGLVWFKLLKPGQTYTQE